MNKGGRFGKYGDIKRKKRLQESRLSKRLASKMLLKSYNADRRAKRR